MRILSGEYEDRTLCSLSGNRDGSEVDGFHGWDRQMRVDSPKGIPDFIPPQGATFTQARDCPLAKISRDLCKVAAFLQGLPSLSRLVKSEDWRDHDGLYFEQCPTNFPHGFERIQTPEAILAATPDDDYVFVGVASEDRAWCLRFRAEGDNPGKNRLGFFSVRLDHPLVIRFEREVIPHWECPVTRTRHKGFTRSPGPILPDPGSDSPVTSKAYAPSSPWMIRSKAKSKSSRSE